MIPDDPISNSPIPPISPTPDNGPGKPGLGEEETAQRPFSLPPEPPSQQSPEPAPSEKMTPMDVLKDAAQRSPQLPPEVLESQVRQLHEKFAQIKGNLQDSKVTSKFSNDHYEAMGRVTSKLNPDMRSIASTTNTSYEPPEKNANESPLAYITRWINGSQETLTNALKFLSDPKVQNHPNPATFLRLQYAVQRATQRGELFASIVGASVSGIKTIMSTQLG